MLNDECVFKLFKGLISSSTHIRLINNGANVTATTTTKKAASITFLNQKVLRTHNKYFFVYLFN